jgi:hypothetical protein
MEVFILSPFHGLETEIVDDQEVDGCKFGELPVEQAALPAVCLR